LKKRLYYLDDDDLLLPAFYRHYASVWQNPDGVRSQFHSLAAWQLVSDWMLFDAGRFASFLQEHDIDARLASGCSGGIPDNGARSIVSEAAQSEHGRPSRIERDIKASGRASVMLKQKCRGRVALRFVVRSLEDKMLSIVRHNIVMHPRLDIL
jgi:hypothetical protein